MKLSEVISGIPVLELHADPDMEITGVECDSRAVKSGNLFAAIPGFSSDGHKFIPMAVRNGCAAVLCQVPPQIEVPYILVEDSRLCLALCSCSFYRHPSREMKIIGITGTNGKTTTSVIVKQLLEKCLHTKVGLVGSICNMIGDEEFHTEHTTPESNDLQRLFRQRADAGCTHCVLEGSSPSLVLHRVAGTSFAAGVFTNLTQDHLDFHETMEAYAGAKAMLFPMCRTAAGNADDQWFDTVMADAPRPIYTFSAKKDTAELTARNVRLPPDRARFCALGGRKLVRPSLGLPGQFSVYNALTALACARMMGVPLKDAAEALPGCRGAKGRLEPVPTDGDYTIYIDYAVTPDAVENVLKTLRPIAPGRLVMLFGCGGDRDRKKRPIMGRIASELSDFVIVTSDNPRTEDPQAIIDEILPGLEGGKTPYKVICDRPSAIRWAIENHQDGDLILLCGKGHEDYQIIGHEKIHMDEREIVAEILREREERK